MENSSRERFSSIFQSSFATSVHVIQDAVEKLPGIEGIEAVLLCCLISVLSIKRATRVVGRFHSRNFEKYIEILIFIRDQSWISSLGQFGIRKGIYIKEIIEGKVKESKIEFMKHEASTREE